MSTVTSTKLKDILSRDEKSVKADELNLVVETAKLQIEADIIAAKRKLNAAQTEMNVVLGKTPFSPANFINSKRAAADASADLKDLESLKTELF